MKQEKSKSFTKVLGENTGLLIAISLLAVFVPSCVSFGMWITAESYEDLQNRGGIKVELAKIMRSQILEYAANGKASSKLYVNVHCYDSGKTKFLKSSNSIVNVVRGHRCDGFAFRDSIAPESRAERIFIRDSAHSGLKKAIRVSCEGRYYGEYQVATSDETMPQLQSGRVASCPPDASGEPVSPEFEEYFIRQDGHIFKA